MAIIIQIGAEKDGFGDYFFCLKLADGLKKRAAAAGYQDEICVVGSEEQVQVLNAMGATTGLQVKLLTLPEYNKLAKAGSLTPDCFIRGPVPTAAPRNIHVPIDTPIIATAEYSRAVPCGSGFPSHPNQSYIKTGFDISDMRDPELGIIFSDGLSRLIAKANDHDQPHERLATLDQQWGLIRSTFRDRILSHRTSGHYDESTQLSFQYFSTHACRAGDSREHYLKFHDLFTSRSSKNQDIIAVGKDVDRIKKSLATLLPRLKERGYTNVTFVSSNGEETCLYQQDASSMQKPKTYRLLQFDSLSNAEMLAMQALSTKLVGTTGDQSLGMSISASKLPIYEVRGHKMNMVDKLLESVKILTGNKDLVELLTELMSHDIIKSGNKRDIEKIEALLHNPDVLKAWDSYCAKMEKDHNLTDNFLKAINLEKIMIASAINNLNKVGQINKEDSSQEEIEPAFFLRRAMILNIIRTAPPEVVKGVIEFSAQAFPKETYSCIHELGDCPLSNKIKELTTISHMVKAIEATLKDLNRNSWTIFSYTSNEDERKGLTNLKAEINACYAEGNLAKAKSTLEAFNTAKTYPNSSFKIITEINRLSSALPSGEQIAELTKGRAKKTEASDSGRTNPTA
jgi:hypothetical protein